MAVPQQPPAAAPTGPPVITHPPGLDSATAASGRTNSPAVATPSAAAPNLNGVAPMILGGTNGQIPPYRPGYPNYPLYAPYSNLHHSPYLPPAVPSPAASPCTIDSRTNRESPLILSNKSMRPATPTNNHNTTSQQMLGSHREHQSALSTRSNSPRGHSPNRERDSYRFVFIFFKFFFFL